MKEGWEIKKLGEVCKKTNNVNWISINSDVQYRYVDLSSVNRDTCNIEETVYVNKDNAPSRAKQLILTNDVLFATTRPTLRRVCLVECNYNDSLCSTGFCVLRPSDDILNSKYIFYILLSERFYNYIEPLQKGINYPAVSNNDVFNFKISVPPLSEQTRIVEELDLLNGILDKKRQQLKELDDLSQSIFYDMFGDPIANEKGWEINTIEQICSNIIRGPFGSALKKEYFVPKALNTYKVYEQKHAIQKDINIGTYYISEDMYNSLKRFAVKPGDIIMSCSGTIGELFIIPNKAEKGIMNQALLKFTLNKKVLLSYFMFIMESVKKSFDVKGCGIKNIGSVKYIKKIPIPVPPLPLQQSFAEKIQSIEHQKELIKQSIAETQTLLDSRMDFYFN